MCIKDKLYIALYDKLLKKNGPSKICVGAANKFSGITRDNVRKWVRNRHALSNIGKNWKNEECEKLLKLCKKHPNPNDWKTIGPLMKRQWMACKNKYEQLVGEDQYQCRTIL